MGERFKSGDRVIFQVGQEHKVGRVIDTYLQNGVNMSQHNNMYNTASRSALLIELNDGSKVLKLEDEVKRG